VFPDTLPEGDYRLEGATWLELAGVSLWVRQGEEGQVLVTLYRAGNETGETLGDAWATVAP
jgi:hypothetical protein